MKHIILAEISEVDVLRDPDRALAHAYIESCFTYFIETEQKHDRLPTDIEYIPPTAYLSDLRIQTDDTGVSFTVTFTKE